MDPDRAQRLIWSIAILGFALFAVSLLGELLGWWNDIGEVGMQVGATTGLASVLIGLLFAASRTQVRGVHDVAASNGSKLESMDLKLDKLDSMDTKLDKLDSMDTKLEKLDRLDTLDAIQFRLDAQTGVLSQQLHLLAAIRDGLLRARPALLSSTRP